MFEVAADPAPRLVGRQAEIAEIHRWVRAGGPILLVTGAPGAGKSALVAEALSAPRVDLGDADLVGAWDAIEATPAGIVWLDDADPVLVALGLAPEGRRFVVTCRYPIDHPLATRIHLDPLSVPDGAALLDRWLATRFSGAAPSQAERDRWVAAADGNPVRLRQILWTNEGGAPPPGLARHQTEREMMTWGLRGLPDEALRVLRRMVAAPPPVDDDAASALLGRDDQRPVLASLRSRWLLVQVDGCWSVPEPVREAVEPDPSGLEPLRKRVVERFRALERGEVVGAALAAWHRCAWGLLTWAVGVTTDLDELGDLVQAVDYQALWGGMSFDSRPILRAALLRLSEEEDHWWVLRRLAQAEVRFGMQPDDPEIQRLFERSVALADRYPPPSFLLARRAWATTLAESGQLRRAIGLLRETAELARVHRENAYEASARTVEATCHLRAGSPDEALWCARAAMAVNPNPDVPWTNQLAWGEVLAEVGRDQDARAVWRTAIRHLRAAGRGGYAVLLEVEDLWTRMAGGEEPEGIRSALVGHHAVLIETRSAQAAGVAALYTAAVELVCGRPEMALGWVRRATVFRDRAMEVRAVGAVAYRCLGLPVRWDELPGVVAEVDPRLEGLAQGIGAGPGRLGRVLGRVR